MMGLRAAGGGGPAEAAGWTGVDGQVAGSKRFRDFAPPPRWDHDDVALSPLRLLGTAQWQKQKALIGKLVALLGVPSAGASGLDHSVSSHNRTRTPLSTALPFQRLVGDGSLLRQYVLQTLPRVLAASYQLPAPPAGDATGMAGCGSPCWLAATPSVMQQRRSMTLDLDFDHDLALALDLDLVPLSAGDLPCRELSSFLVLVLVLVLVPPEYPTHPAKLGVPDKYSHV
ncbi:hypothetical protein J7T55_001870 [Diaporthe amygdali]|uniref:uncharacterized protein n=1 Tax=Phomopsis amygdali TaxID=1214568 RepID=UPI0022FE7390|nr:uncharacterized protein J7T55_001870 [Diaporthe amygdali]KAJ0117671.1 hypothetical protein J7T55_001870 [Diaporthe amygdali]